MRAEQVADVLQTLHPQQQELDGAVISGDMHAGTAERRERNVVPSQGKRRQIVSSIEGSLISGKHFAILLEFVILITCYHQ